MKLFFILFFCVIFFTAFCVNDSKIVTSDGRVIRTSQVKLRPGGDLEYLSEDGKLKHHLPKGRYQYAWIPKPALITEADAKFKAQAWKDAAAGYRRAAAEYQFLGWEAYCIRMEAQALAFSGEKNVALMKLRQLRKTPFRNPDTAADLAMADDLMAELLINAKKYNEAQIILAKQVQSDNPDLVFSAFFKLAVIQQQTGKTKDAAMTFYQTALMFPNNTRRAEALYNAWSLLAELRDPVAPKIADMLNREYPDSQYARKTFR